ncbi:hypothetical protein M9458_042532, partial [Cirrhinus mrigala]
KLQVKPIPVSRRNAPAVDAKEDTAALSFKHTTSLPISTQEMRSVPEQTVPAEISSTDDSISASNKTHSPVPEESIMGKVGPSDKETVELGSGQITPIAT